jgi:hypothetical protein
LRHRPLAGFPVTICPAARERDITGFGKLSDNFLLRQFEAAPDIREFCRARRGLRWLRWRRTVWRSRLFGHLVG